MPSNEQRVLFSEVVRQAEAAGAVEGPPEAARCLAAAKSDFNYAQRIPRYPDRARQLATQAQVEGAEALRLAQQHRREMAALARQGARAEAVADVATTAAPVAPAAPEATALADVPTATPDTHGISVTTTATETTPAAVDNPGPTSNVGL